ncbi:hypothetical protein, partial [Streptomyces clavuligerus]|uniref:hypothetical protein n=1 Tax=Streptomyces clavuligerus TaxID=1901 RepID=UPI001E4B0DD3
MDELGVGAVVVAEGETMAGQQAKAVQRPVLVGGHRMTDQAEEVGVPVGAGGEDIGRGRFARAGSRGAGGGIDSGLEDPVSGGLGREGEAEPVLEVVGPELGFAFAAVGAVQRVQTCLLHTS